MVTMTATKAREELFPLLGKVNQDRDIVRITSKAGNGVLISEDDYDEMETILHLYSTPANAKRLNDSLERAARNDVIRVNPDTFEIES